MATASSQMSPQQANMLARMAVLQLSLPVRIKKGTYGPYSMGQKVSIDLDRTGLFTHIGIDFTASADITAAATASQMAPYSLLGAINYRDFSNFPHGAMAGPQLFVLNSLRNGRLFDLAGNNMQATTGAPLVGSVDTALTAVPTAVATAPISGSLIYPLAYNPQTDLTGAVNAQVGQGQHTIDIQINNAAVGSDGYISPYTGGTVAISDIYFDIYEYYYVVPSNVPLPMLDLAKIYGLQGNITDSSNLVAGQAKVLSWPGNQTVLSAGFFYDNGGAGTVNSTDISELDLVYNITTQMETGTPQILRREMRRKLNADIFPGWYIQDRRGHPVNTQFTGEVQTRLTPNGAPAAGAYIASFFETIYLAGSAIGGAVQG